MKVLQSFVLLILSVLVASENVTSNLSDDQLCHSPKICVPQKECSGPSVPCGEGYVCCEVADLAQKISSSENMDTVRKDYDSEVVPRSLEYFDELYNKNDDKKPIEEKHDYGNTVTDSKRQHFERNEFRNPLQNFNNLHDIHSSHFGYSKFNNFNNGLPSHEIHDPYIGFYPEHSFSPEHYGHFRRVETGLKQKFSRRPTVQKLKETSSGSSKESILNKPLTFEKGALKTRQPINLPYIVRNSTIVHLLKPEDFKRSQNKVNKQKEIVVNKNQKISQGSIPFLHTYFEQKSKEPSKGKDNLISQKKSSHFTNHRNYDYQYESPYPHDFYSIPSLSFNSLNSPFIGQMQPYSPISYGNFPVQYDLNSLSLYRNNYGDFAPDYYNNPNFYSTLDPFGAYLIENHHYKKKCGTKSVENYLNPSQYGYPQHYGYENFGFKIHRHPWQGAILGWTNYGYGLKCSATLINSFMMVTSAHCLSGIKEPDVKVIFGADDLLDPYSPLPIIERPVFKIFVHEKYDSSTLVHDIALIFLPNSIDFHYTPHIGPACLPKPNHEFNPKHCRIVGWPENHYRTYEQQASNEIKVTEMRLLSAESCKTEIKNLAKHLNPSKITEEMHCVKGIKESNYCIGSGGGSLLCEEHCDGKNCHGSSVYLAGVVTWSNEKCGTDALAIVTEVSPYTNWILNLLKGHKKKSSSYSKSLDIELPYGQHFGYPRIFQTPNLPIPYYHGSIDQRYIKPGYYR